MKRFIALLLALVLCVGLVACAEKPPITETHETHNRTENIIESYSNSETVATVTEPEETKSRSEMSQEELIEEVAPPEPETQETTVEIIEPDNPVTPSTETPSDPTNSEETTEPSHTHVFNIVSEDTPATCEQDGRKVETCSCGAQKVTTYGKLGHDYKLDSNKEATCTEDGSVTYKCVRCNDVYTARIAKTGHSYIHNRVEPTCVMAGHDLQKCTKCGYEEETTLAALGHDYQTTQTSATCTTGGTTTKKCSRCNDTKTETTPALGHDYKTTSTTPATCSSEGSKVETCSRCRNKITTVIPKTDHKYKITETPATCTTAGSRVEKCTVCGDIKSQTNIPALGHSWKTYTTPATCTASGSSYEQCERCGAKQNQQTIPALGHNYKTTVTAPTCTAKGYTTHTCSRCGDTYKDSYTDMVPHQPETVVVVQPTETTPGLERDICKVCNTVLAEREIPATGIQPHTHNWVKFLVESNMNNNTNFPFVFPTGENGGSLAVQYGDWYVYYCSQCKHLYYDYYKNDPNHAYTNSGMIRCDYRKTNDEAEIEMQALVNDLRQANGKSRLSLDPICQAIARRRAVETYWNNDHSGRDPRTCENIGGGPNVAHDFTGLCNSSGHRATMLYSYLEYMGYGIYYTGFLPCFGSVQVFSDWASLYDE